MAQGIALPSGAIVFPFRAAAERGKWWVPTVRDIAGEEHVVELVELAEDGGGPTALCETGRSR